MDMPRATQPLLKPRTPKVDQLLAAQSAVERLAQGLGHTLQSLCTTPLTFTASPVEPSETRATIMRYAGGMAAIYAAPDANARIVIGMDRRCAFTLIEAAYGGDGSLPAVVNDRPLSVLESRFAHAVFDLAAPALQAVLTPVTPAAWTFETLLTGLDAGSAGLSNAPCLVARLALQSANGGGCLFMILPRLAHEPLADAPATTNRSEITRRDPDWQRGMHAHIWRTAVRVEATLEGQAITLGEIAQLSIGQVLALRPNAKDLVVLECQGEPVYRCRLGQSGGAFTVIVDAPADPHDQAAGYWGAD